MDSRRRSVLEISIEDLDRELIARGAKSGGKKQFDFKDKEGTAERNALMTGVEELYKKPPPANGALADLSTWELAKTLVFRTRSLDDIHKGEGAEGLKDWYEMIDVKTAENANCTAAVMFKDNLIDGKNRFSTLKVKNYGKTFNLCDFEPFRDQPVSAGLMFTGFLVKDDVIATVGHHIDENNVTALRIVFGYKMMDAYTPETRFSNEDIYRGVKIIHKDCKGNGGNWVLVKLDRKVKGRTAAELSEENMPDDPGIYVIGHPLGLPLKYSDQASLCDNTHDTYFTADLNIYSGGSGSPVFDFYTHEVIGIVVRNENNDFRWTGKCWVSVNSPEGKKSNCTRVSEFIDIVRGL